MVITEQQYNSVITGLKTQLELQRAQTAEKTATIHQLVAHVNTLTSEAEMDLELLKKVVDQKTALQTKIAQLVAVACGDEVPGILDTNDPQIAAICACRADLLDTIQLQSNALADCKPRRSGKCCKSK